MKILARMLEVNVIVGILLLIKDLRRYLINFHILVISEQKFSGTRI